MKKNLKSGKTAGPNGLKPNVIKYLILEFN